VNRARSSSICRSVGFDAKEKYSLNSSAADNACRMHRTALIARRAVGCAVRSGAIGPQTFNSVNVDRGPGFKAPRCAYMRSVRVSFRRTAGRLVGNDPSIARHALGLVSAMADAIRGVVESPM